MIIFINELSSMLGTPEERESVNQSHASQSSMYMAVSQEAC